MAWFKFKASETIRSRVVRCCNEALKDGEMGEFKRQAFYKEFINCNMDPAGIVGKAQAKSIHSWKTSCALFVRAVHYWCGKPTKTAVNGSGMFDYLGGVSYGHRAWVRNDGLGKPKPGDFFYVASTPASNDGHTGIFLEELEPGLWKTAEGGGGDGTICKFGRRDLRPGAKFDPWRKLIGWFSVDLCGTFHERAEPEEPVEAVVLVKPAMQELSSKTVSGEPEDKPVELPARAKESNYLFWFLAAAFTSVAALLSRFCQ